MDKLRDIKSRVSNCLNTTTATYFEGYENRRASAYQVLAHLMKKDYELTERDVNNVVDHIEHYCAEYIAEKSPNLGAAEE